MGQNNLKPGDIDDKLKLDDDEGIEMDGLQNLKKAKWIINPESVVKKYWDLINIIVVVNSSFIFKDLCRIFLADQV